jgi:hypothetical protein
LTFETRLRQAEGYADHRLPEVEPEPTAEEYAATFEAGGEPGYDQVNAPGFAEALAEFKAATARWRAHQAANPQPSKRLIYPNADWPQELIDAFVKVCDAASGGQFGLPVADRPPAGPVS